MIVLDTSVLVDALTGPQRSLKTLRCLIEAGERTVVPALVLYEWLRGPRLPDEMALRQSLYPDESILPFGPAEAAVAAELYQDLRRARGREVDLAIAASALACNAELWTLNRGDFRDIPGLRLFKPRG